MNNSVKTRPQRRITQAELDAFLKYRYRISVSKNVHALIFLFCGLRLLLYTYNNLNRAVKWTDMPLSEFTRKLVERKLTEYCERNIPTNQRK